MTIKHIKDQIENYAIKVAREAYLEGLRDSIKEGLNPDEISDKLEKIVKDKLKGE